jgi:hypothetical protein
MALLSALFRVYRADMQEGERFGDFLVRSGRVSEIHDGRVFHAAFPPRSTNIT